MDVTVMESTIAGGDPATPATVLVNHLVTDSPQLFQYNIPSSMLRTFHTQTQLNLKLNNSYAVCPNRNCQVSTIY